jgi:peptidoglycan-N-acetylglucosamine deacetylase
MTDPMRKAQAVGRAAGIGLGVAPIVAALGRRNGPAGAALALGAGIAGWAAFTPNHPGMGPVLSRGPRGPRAALTFDDGPGPSTPLVLDALAAAGVRATFFVLGRQVERHVATVRRMVAEGHELASHGFDHGILVFRGARHLADQLRRTEAAVADAVGADVLSRLFRAPHGFRGPLTWPAARSLGYRTVGWSRGVFDSSEPGAEIIAERAARALVPGAVILLHDADGWAPERSRRQTAEALPAICRSARSRGLSLVTMDTLVSAA